MVSCTFYPQKVKYGFVYCIEGKQPVPHPYRSALADRPSGSSSLPVNNVGEMRNHSGYQEGLVVHLISNQSSMKLLFLFVV